MRAARTATPMWFPAPAESHMLTSTPELTQMMVSWFLRGDSEVKREAGAMPALPPQL